jgi:hypothetical protein
MEGIELFINHYEDKSPERNAELVACLEHNINNPAIHSICLASESEVPFKNMKIRNVVWGKRPTYKDFFFMMSNSKYDTKILANSDIIFSECIPSPPEGTCYAVSRWDIEAIGAVPVPFHRRDSQDVWTFTGKVPEGIGDFTMGVAGCDNKIAHELNEVGVKLVNCPHDLKCFHLHASAVRNYVSENGTIERLPPPYMLVPVEKLNWLLQIQKVHGKGYSQYEEQAIIEFIFQNIGVHNKRFVDLGAGQYGPEQMSNTKFLYEKGWWGFGVDAENITEPYIIQKFITPDNVVSVLKEQGTPETFDFLNLDLDSSDYWVLASLLEKYKPRLICAEFNGTLDPNISVALKYEEGYTWDKTNKYGFSFTAGVNLLKKHGYSVIFNQHDLNIFAAPSEYLPEPITVTATKRTYHPNNPNAVWQEV